MRFSLIKLLKINCKIQYIKELKYFYEKFFLLLINIIETPEIIIAPPI